MLERNIGFTNVVENSVINGIEIIPLISSRKPGDVNGDTFVNITDLSMMLSNWNSTTFLQADFDGSGKVDIGDLSRLLSNWGK